MRENDGIVCFRSSELVCEPPNSLHYFSSGAAFFEDVFQKLQAAKKYIYLELFIYAEGGLAERIFHILREKAAEGVAVYVIYDELGGFECMKSGRFTEAAKAGVHLYAFNPLTPFINLNVNYRDHRKIIVIDGETAYTGGINIADEYVDLKHDYGYWKDCGVRLEADWVGSFIYMFERTWFALTKQYIGNIDQFKEQDHNSCIAFCDGVEYNKNVCEEVYLKLFNDTKRQITIMTPYFMPGSKIIRVLTKAAKRGVKVTVYLPYVPDKFYVHLVSRLNAEKLLQHGIIVKYMRSGFLHSKIVLCDEIVSLSTANFDYRSFYMQEECGMISNDQEFVREVREDIANLDEISIAADEKNSLFQNKFRTLVAYSYNLISYFF